MFLRFKGLKAFRTITKSLTILIKSNTLIISFKIRGIKEEPWILMNNKNQILSTIIKILEIITTIAITIINSTITTISQN